MPMFDYLYGVALRDLDITKGLSTFENDAELLGWISNHMGAKQI